MKPRTFVNDVYVAFNYMPGGQISVQHFVDDQRKRRVGEQVEEILIKAADAAKDFKKSEFVALNINGKIVKNEVLVYDGPPLGNNPRAQQIVKDWAISKGLQPIRPPESQAKGMPYQYEKRIDTLEARQDKTDKKIDNVSEKLDKVLEAVSVKA